VAKSTIYRHWPGRAELVNDAFRTLQPPVYECQGGDVRSRVVQLLEDLAERTAESTWSACLPSLVDAAARDPEAREALHSRLAGRRTLVDLLTEGVASGELAPDLDAELMAEALAGPILLRRLFATTPLANDQVRRIVEQILPVRGGDAPTPPRPGA
jgi:AcrR family transcriptional regulator